MPGFADSFWSGDYAGGLGVLFDKLHQGVVENEQVLTVARLRAEAEDVYGRKLSEIMPSTDRLPNGFQRDDGASLKKVPRRPRPAARLANPCAGLRGNAHGDERGGQGAQEDLGQHQ